MRVDTHCFLHIHDRRDALSRVSRDASVSFTDVIDAAKKVVCAAVHRVEAETQKTIKEREKRGLSESGRLPDETSGEVKLIGIIIR